MEHAFRIAIPKDGSCFFASIEYHFAENSGNTALELRDLVCEHLLYNQLETIEDVRIRDLMILSDHIENALASDSEIVAHYIQSMRRSDEWADSLEISILCKLKNLNILIFERNGDFYALRDTFGTRVGGQNPRCCFLFFDGAHYEPLNIVNASVVDSILRSTKLASLEGDVNRKDGFILSCSRFASYNDYRKSLKIVTQSTRFNPDSDRHDFALLTMGARSDPDPAVAPHDPVPNLIAQLKGDSSEGAQSLRDRRPLEVDAAILSELEQMGTKEVWRYLSPDDVKNRYTSRPIPLIMLVKEKFDSAGKFVKVKARAVALGNQQAPMADFKKEAPTASILSFYIVIFLSSKLGIRLRAKDVTGAFLNAELPVEEQEVILISAKHAKIIVASKPMLKHMMRSNGTMLALLIRCLYGLKQSPQRWFKTIRKLLLSLGLTASEHDSCLFYKFVGSEVNYLLLFVDDMLIAFQSQQLYTDLCAALFKTFGEISEQEGDVISFLGITITQSAGQITLDQKGFITKLKDSLNLTTIPVYKNPVRSDFSVCQDRFLKPQSEANPARLTQMRKLTMAVMYCAQRTRRDVLFATSFLASITCPEVEDIAAITRVIVYLFNTIDKKQFFYREGVVKLILYGDASHNLFANARGQQCEIIYGDEVSAALDMSSVKEKEVTNSSYESELIVQNKVSDKGILVAKMFKELRIPYELPMVMYSDNEAAVLTASTEHINKMGRSKFMNRKLFYLHDKVVDGWVQPTWIETGNNDSDLGTKNIMGSHYEVLANRQFSRMHGSIESIQSSGKVLAIAEPASKAKQKAKVQLVAEPSSKAKTNSIEEPEPNSAKSKTKPKGVTGEKLGGS